MASSFSGSFSRPQSAFSHSNGRKTSIADPYGENSRGSSGINATPDKTNSEETQGKSGNHSTWKKEGTCYRVARDAWHKVKFLFQVATAPLSGKAKGNAETNEVELDVMSSDTHRSNRGAGSSANSMPGHQPQPQPPAGHERIRTQTWSQRYKTRFGSRRDKYVPRNPYDNGFLSTPRSTPCSTLTTRTPCKDKTNVEEFRKTPSPGKWFAGLL
ncbi:uncharacterized protein F4812DRAFT_461475 [Daldinia caldariorum]|uniref:uncharacterized protein n=1 Tax=Daldinia caldariorum TaxID=326644 RepID=UPI00200848DE|nr:uncharacterized protein F4812DRAFT_461475 [Daldinia caldariorum]KAI1465787.1 hypothetical protein F4812DRAFT_461475 [Daldinia caldariorum]